MKQYAEKSGKMLIIGIIGCLLYVIGDFLYAATAKGQGMESYGIMITTAFLEIANWRMWASILCGWIGTMLYYMGFHRMYGLLKIRITEKKDGKWLRLFRVAYVTASVSWAYFHAMCMNIALIFKFVFQEYGDVTRAAGIANRVFYANSIPMVGALILGDLLLTVTMIVFVWKKIIPLKNTASRILATLCNPLLCAGIIGNLFSLLPWPLDQIDHASESLGHMLVLILGLVLLREMTKQGALPKTGSDLQ